MAERALAARSPLAALTVTSGLAPALTAVDCPTPGLARVVVRKGCLPQLSRLVHETFGLELPRGPRRIGNDRLAFVGVGADAWLAVAGQNPEVAQSLVSAVGEFAAISAQNGGYALLRLSGPKVRDALAKMLPIDLHQRNFATNAAATTLAGHIAITLWRLADAREGSPVFEIAVPRSLAVSFAEVLAHSAAEFGFTYSPCAPHTRSLT